MNRPARKLKHLEEKLAAKEGRKNANEGTKARTGAKLKRWKKSVAAYKPLVAQE
ncbi:MAG: hypothetical protein HOW73_25050 [Polyangiaceae bacterium]|nr:hypothetical protein [Polyangiaceae bacterium]